MGEIQKRNHKRTEVDVVALTDKGVVKLAKIVQGKDGSMYVVYKIKGYASKHTRHSNGLRQTTFINENTEYVNCESWTKPIKKLRCEQAMGMEGTVNMMRKVYGIKYAVKKNRSVIKVDLRSCHEVIMRIYYANPKYLKKVMEAISLLNDTAKIYVSKKINPNIVISVTLRKNEREKK